MKTYSNIDSAILDANTQLGSICEIKDANDGANLLKEGFVNSLKVFSIYKTFSAATFKSNYITLNPVYSVKYAVEKHTK